ncbi:uncharacterized protein G2W53_019337 [Senna tora]|uniref:Uncharacterized protein n=1 Tax=Senna tora TaxID=362788 RepID=A0A834TUA6_9FABA|nr:uncharacterized protein G2W53_019337 [Senna tora]
MTWEVHVVKTAPPRKYEVL